MSIENDLASLLKKEESVPQQPSLEVETVVTPITSETLPSVVEPPDGGVIPVIDKLDNEDFIKGLRKSINYYGIDNYLNTPDHELADFVISSLKSLKKIS